MRKVFICLLLIVAVTAPGDVWAQKKPKHLVVHGQNDPLVDPGNLQDAISNVRTNGTVTLVGTFQLDGSFVFIDRGHITIEGVALDNDGDGSVNEDWADGIDNDGDGAVDEDDWDASLNGIIGGDGKPVDDLQPPDFTFFNRGLTLWGASKSVNKVTIRNIKFHGFNRGIEFGADTFFTDGIVCSEIQSTKGSVKNAVIEGNWFDNNERGMQIFGEAKNNTIRDNLFTNTVRAYTIPIVGGGAFCFDDDGLGSEFPFGVPTGTTIIGNRFDGGERGAIGIFDADETTIANNVVSNYQDQFGSSTINAFSPNTIVTGNTVTDSFNGILTANVDSLVEGNHLSNIGYDAIIAFSDGTGTLITNNVITDVFFGVLITNANGFTASNNIITNAGAWDYFLNVGTFENTVILLPGQTVDDRGTDNDIQ